MADQAAGEFGLGLLSSPLEASRTDRGATWQAARHFLNFNQFAAFETIERDRLSALLPEDWPTSSQARVLSSKRVRKRLAGYVNQRLDLAPCRWRDFAAPSSMRLGWLGKEGLQHVIQTTGAIYHAHSLARLISGEDLRRLLDKIGEPAYRMALEKRHLAHAGAGDMPADRLFETLLEDGKACLHAWCLAKPPSVGRRVALMMELDGDAFEPDFLHRACGIPIVDAVALTMLREAGLSEAGLGEAGTSKVSLAAETGDG